MFNYQPNFADALDFQRRYIMFVRCPAPMFVMCRYKVDIPKICQCQYPTFSICLYGSMYTQCLRDAYTQSWSYIYRHPVHSAFCSQPIIIVKISKHSPECLNSSKIPNTWLMERLLLPLPQSRYLQHTQNTQRAVRFGGNSSNMKLMIHQYNAVPFDGGCCPLNEEHLNLFWHTYNESTQIGELDEFAYGSIGW